MKPLRAAVCTPQARVVETARTELADQWNQLIGDEGQALPHQVPIDAIVRRALQHARSSEGSHSMRLRGSRGFP